jgi:serine protease AprX
MNIAAKTIRCRPPDGIDGRNICIAVLDTGLCPVKDFSLPPNRIVCFKDFVNGKSQMYDDNGHGTHVSGCLGSCGIMSGGLYRGIAPACNIAVLKILDESGSGTAGWTYEAVNWLLANHQKYNIQVVNMSVGSSDKSISRQLSASAAALWEKGMVVCAAAGNNDPYGITSPGINSSVITVGSWEDKKMYRLKYNRKVYLKPDIFAPGRDIISCMADDFSFDGSRRKKDNMVGSHYIKMSGSSMATPMVSGAAALLLQHNPLLTPNQVKDIMVSASLKNQNQRLLNVEEMFKAL